jgi:hypothetical protein
MRVKTADPGRFLDGLDADVASMIAALGWAFLPTRSAPRMAVSTRNQVPGIAQASEIVEDRLPWWKVTW